MNVPAWLRILFNIFFWIFNGSLLFIAYVGLFPFIGFALIKDALIGQVPLDFLLPFIGLVGVPTASTVVYAVPKLRRSRLTPKGSTGKPLSLFEFFYSIEAPLLLVCVVRFFWLRDLSPGASLLLMTGAIGTIAHLYWRFRHHSPTPDISKQPPHPELDPADSTLTSRRALASGGTFSPSSRFNSLTQWLHLAGHTLMLGISLYMVAIAAFYVLPFLILVLPGLPAAIIYALVVAPITVLVVGICTAPFGMTVVHGRAWLQSYKHLAARNARYAKWAGGFSAVVLASWLALFLFLQQPPQVQAFQLLENPAQTEGDRQALLQQSETIRRGLINAYLAPYRYPRSPQDDRHIFDLYRYSLKLPEPIANRVQDLYNLLLAPFSYVGDIHQDAEKAAGLYAQFFDVPLVRAELPAIEKAIQSTFDRNGAKAGLADINARRVWLAEQQLTVTPHGDYADVEVYEVYANQTPQQQEILYYFSLPESAAITGVWLGETGDRSQAFSYVVAPRGAAQQVYNEEVNRSYDPALLEQVGPRTYRLRAFPILPVGEGNMHLWFTYKVLKQDAGWAMPTLLERRNLFWSNDTQRKVNGESVPAKDQWLPTALPADSNIQPALHEVSLPWGASVLATPFADESYNLPQGKRFAVILDGSYSMNSHQQEITQTFRWLTENLLPQNQADLYLTTTAPLTPKRMDNVQGFDLDTAQFYSTLQPREMLQQFLDLRGETTYDAVVLITDPGSYELSTDSTEVVSMPAPLWMVHLGGLQFAYDDATVQAMQYSGGGVATDVREVMQRIGTQPTQGNGTTLLNVVDGYAWFLTETANPSIPKAETFNALAARQWVTHLSQYVKPEQLEQLDTIHAVTKEYSIVTPYSSMIVLVNDRQRDRLRELEQSDDRFNREIEDQQALPQPASLSAVPEPAEWVLLLIGAIVLGALYLHQRNEDAIQGE